MKSTKELTEEIERLRKRLTTFEASICDRLNRAIMQIDGLESLESPNQSDCPLGKKCYEDRGYWIDSPTQGSVFEECGESCPRKVDERAETIRRARGAVEIRMDLLRDQGTMEFLTLAVCETILEALDIAEQLNKGE